MRVLWFILSWVYGLLLHLRYFFLKFKLIKRYSFNIPIISIGNLTVGGTGKTPMTIFLSGLLTKNNISHVIISRGYKKGEGGSFVVNTNNHSPKDCGDEPFLMATKLIKTPIVVGNKKHRAIRLAIKMFNPKAILLDDGFQSLSIGRDLDIVLINSLDYKKPFCLIPLGNLREKITALQRANLVVFTKNNLLDKKNIANKYKQSIINQLKEYNIPFLFSNIKSKLLLCCLDDLSIKKCSMFINSTPSLGFCGVGDPVSFKKTMKLYFKNIVHIENYEDHYNYHKNCSVLMNLVKYQFKKNKIKNIIVTYKDWIKIKGVLSGFFSWLKKNKLSLYIIDIDIELNDKSLLLDESLKHLFLSKK